MSKNVSGLEITVGKEMKFTAMKKKSLRVMHFNENSILFVIRPIQGDRALGS